MGVNRGDQRVFDTDCPGAEVLAMVREFDRNRKRLTRRHHGSKLALHCELAKCQRDESPVDNGGGHKQAGEDN